ncbi:MAG: YncE family protein [Acidimicrobiales bacterium]|jgi:YVTN family beta-propeller protein
MQVHIERALRLAGASALLTFSVVLALGGDAGGAKSGNETIGLKIQVAAMAVDSQGTLAYVTSINSSQISMVNLTTKQVSAIPIRKGSNINNVALTPNNRELFVTSNGSNSVGYSRTLYVVDTKSMRVTSTINVGGSSSAVAFGPGGRMAYVVAGDGSYGSGEALKTIDVASHKIVHSFPIPSGSSMVTVDPRDGDVYVASNSSSGTDNSPASLEAINAITGKVVATFGPGNGEACGLAFNPKATLLYESFCASVGSGSTAPPMQVIDTKKDSVESKISIDGGSRGIAISPNGKLVYTAVDKNYGLDVISSSTNSIVGFIPVATDSPISILNLTTIDSDGQYIYATTFSFGGYSQFFRIELEGKASAA